MGTLTLLPILFYLLIKYLGMCPNHKTKCTQSVHKVDTWAQVRGRTAQWARCAVECQSPRMPTTTAAFT